MNGSRGRVFSVPALPMAVAYDGASAQKFFPSPAGCPLMKPFPPWPKVGRFLYGQKAGFVIE